MMDGRRRSRLDRVGPYKIGRKIGRGNFATVRCAKHEIAKTKVAVKIVDKNAVDEENLLKIEREIRILKSIEHPHIVKLYEVLRSDRYIYIVTEYCRGGELFDIIIEMGRAPEDSARKWFGQTAAAVAYLHNRGIVHRDLKAENILLDKDGQIKLIDFGFSNIQQPNHLLNTWCGSPPYAAPELLLGQEYDGLKSDIWSLGVLLYILVTGGFPYPGESVDKLKRAIFSGAVKIPYYVSVECSDLIRKMLVLQTTKRYGINNVIQHRWLSMGNGPRVDFTPNDKDSLLPTAILESNRLNPTILLFMQQHGKWTEEQITESVFRKDRDCSIYVTYELLLDKVGRNILEGPAEDHPRRGSRGSILSGKANVEPEPSAPIISAHQLAQLNLSASSDNDSDSSASCDETPMSERRRRDHGVTARTQFGLAMGQQPSWNEHRRHTLCASEQILSPDLLAQLPYLTLFQANQNREQQLRTLAMLEQVKPFLAQNHHNMPNLPGLNTMPLVDYTSMLPVPNNERRASAGENLLQLGVGALDGLSQLMLQQQANASVEEEGQGYLNKFGGKRNTVHGVAAPYGPSSPVARHAPYPKAPSTERRSSWASPAITNQQQSHLEGMYKQALQKRDSGAREGLALQALRKEFQELGKITQHASSSRSNNQSFEAAAMALYGCPRISITDEHNRNLGIGSSQFDPVDMFEKQANEVVYGQRPATVCGFASTSNNKSGGSSPDQTRASEERTSSYISAVPIALIIAELRSSLNQLGVQFQETNEVISPTQEMRRMSLLTGIDIWLTTGMPPEPRSHIEFSITTGESPTSELLCEELMNRLRILDAKHSSSMMQH